MYRTLLRFAHVVFPSSIPRLISLTPTPLSRPPPLILLACPVPIPSGPSFSLTSFPFRLPLLLIQTLLFVLH